jgi:hypothetical protein
LLLLLTPVCLFSLVGLLSLHLLKVSLRLAFLFLLFGELRLALAFLFFLLNELQFMPHLLLGGN